MVYFITESDSNAGDEIALCQVSKATFNPPTSTCFDFAY